MMNCGQQQQQQQQRQLLPSQPQSSTVSEALVTFAGRTSAHGAVRLTQGDAVHRAVWCCLIVLGCCGFCLHLTQLVHRYLMYPVSTEFLTDEVDLQFPAVTICPTDFIVAMSPAIPSNYTIRGKPRGLPQMIYDVPRLFQQLQLPPDWNASVPLEAFSAYEDAKLALKAIAMRRNSVFQEAHETIMICRYNSGWCDYRNFTVYKDEERFLCMTFSPDNRRVVQAGEGNGLHLLLHHNATAFLTDEQRIDWTSGFKVVLHEPGEKPEFSRAFNAALGYKTSAQMHTTIDYCVNRVTSPCEEQLPNVTYTWDYSRPGAYQNVTFFGTLQDCVIRAKQEEFARDCGCLGTHLAMPADLLAVWPPCHQLPEEFFYRDVHFQSNGSAGYYTVTDSSWKYYPLVDYVAENEATFKVIRQHLTCYKDVRDRHNTVGLATSCRMRCLTVLHNVVTTLSAWPSVNSNQETNELVVRSYMDKLMQIARRENRSMARLQALYSQLSQRLSSQFTVIDLYPRSIRATVSREDWAYPLRNLFSDLGGILGLWVGVSIITLIEVLELLLQVAFLTVADSRRRRIQPVESRDTAAHETNMAGTETNELRHIYSSPGDATYQFYSTLPPKCEDGTGAVAVADVIEYNRSWAQKLFSL